MAHLVVTEEVAPPVHARQLLWLEVRQVVALIRREVPCTIQQQQQIVAHSNEAERWEYSNAEGVTMCNACNSCTALINDGGGPHPHIESAIVPARA